MQDRYIYRGKRLDNGEWVTGYIAETESYPYDGTAVRAYIWKIPCVETLVEVDPATVGQCTGLRDKNGTLVFEGDIVRKEIRKNEYYDCEIVWNRCEFGRSGTHGYHPIHELEIEIIGNIHDNPAQLGAEVR